MKVVAQEHTMGCGIACVASLCNLSYKNALDFFEKKYAWSRGYYCREIAFVLKKKDLDYSWKKINFKTKSLIRIGSIVFIARSSKWPFGHYLLKTEKGWMNPWINFPSITPVKAGFQKKLPGKAQWVIYRNQ
ncbi:hypothetical protein J4223_03625 [Candidatus Woesearchaeota archaeon]|nr:hypothetical protein [Candidatus Woesearchaeota archaeon]